MNFGSRSRIIFRNRNATPTDPISESREGEESRWIRAEFWRASCMCCERAALGRRCRKSSGRLAAFMTTFNTGARKASFKTSGPPVCTRTTRWKASAGNGRASTAAWSKPLWHWKRSVGIPPTEEKKGTKRSLLVDQKGLPLAIVISGANTHDVKLLESTLDAVVIERPSVEEGPQHLCADAGYEGKPALQSITDRYYTPHVRSRGEEKTERQEGKKPRRWVVEVTASWLNRFRKLLVRFEKKADNYLALLHFACALITWRKIIPVHA